MRWTLGVVLAGVGLWGLHSEARGRGFGGGGAAHGAGGANSGRGAAGSYAAGWSSFSGEGRAGGTVSGARSADGYSGWGGQAVTSSYDHTWTNAAGASLSTSGTRGIAEGRLGGVAAGSTRETTLTTASGRSYSADRNAGVAAGPMGRTVGGTTGTVEGRAGTSSWESAFSGNRYVGNMTHYASVYGANGVHSTAYWSTGYGNARAETVRAGFGYYGCFTPAWFTAHPGCWFAAGWAAGTAWSIPTYAMISSFCGMNSVAAPNYDYGSTVVFQDNSVYINGQPSGTVQQYAEQATAIANQGQTTTPPATDEWKPLGVYALVQGDEKTSNTIFQLAINKDGILRGNYYEGLSDTTTPVYGSVDPTTQRAAWTIGKNTDRVFEAGLANLTQPQCPCLLHVGTQSTSQLLLVRMEPPSSGH